MTDDKPPFQPFGFAIPIRSTGRRLCRIDPVRGTAAVVRTAISSGPTGSCLVVRGHSFGARRRQALMLVLDASALVGWVMPDKHGMDLLELAATHDDIIAPWLLWAELRNILMVNKRRGRIPAGSAE